MHKWPEDVKTLSVDVGGSGVKGTVLNSVGEMIADRVRIPTPYPCPPERLIEIVVDLASQLPKADRSSLGFPGLVRSGVVLHVPSLSRSVKDGPMDPVYISMWYQFDLQTELGKKLNIPLKVANDADVQGSAVIEGKGLEFVMTLGTGVGGALFQDGVLMPHLELGHAPFRNNEEFEEQIGNAARERIGVERWKKRVKKAVKAYDQFLFYDHCYVGGGNSKHLKGIDLGPKVTRVSNRAGLLGGIRLWELDK
jgi:polyphosphate glucokinase